MSGEKETIIALVMPGHTVSDAHQECVILMNVHILILTDSPNFSAAFILHLVAEELLSPKHCKAPAHCQGVTQLIQHTCFNKDT